MTERSAMLECLDGLVAAFNSHDVDRIMSFFAEDCVLETPRGPDPHGARHQGFAAVAKGLAARFEGIPDVHYGEGRHFIDGDTGISKWRLTGTDTSGKAIDVRGCDFYTFAAGKVVKKDSYWKIVE